VETNLPNQIRSRGRKNVVVDRGDTPERIETSSHEEDKGLAQPLPLGAPSKPWLFISREAVAVIGKCACGSFFCQSFQMNQRPILMTSLAFVLGVVPRMVASGVGEHGGHSVGTTVFGGMIVSAILNLFFIPVLYLIIEGWRERRKAD
jgi:hypothetical protein